MAPRLRPAAGRTAGVARRQRDNPFVAAFAELATLQATQRGFVILPEWAEILDRHFPPAQP
ncbi:hypothetical protein [Streptosporangium sp. NPDC003464]